MLIPEVEHDLVLLRSLMARELETINHYRSLVDRAPNGDARDFFAHIIEEEKLHVADVLRLIAALDADQAHLLSAGFPTGHAPGEIPARAPRPEASGDAPSAPRETSPRRPAASRGELTVGSLRGMPQEATER
jgi:hypothetical protein